MGNEPSSQSATTGPDDAYLPVTGARMSDEMGKREDGDPAPKCARTHIVKTAFTGMWSVVPPASESCPAPRMCHFSCLWEAANCAVIGCGVGKTRDYLNDVWVLNLGTAEWRELRLIGCSISPRAGCRATVVGDVLYVFGGGMKLDMYNDLYAINLGSGECVAVETSGSRPSPRTEAVFGAFGKRLFVWGGYDGGWPSELHVLDLETRVWEARRQEITGRTGLAFAAVGNRLFCYGGTKAGGLLAVNMETGVVEQLQTTGPEPPASSTNGGLVHFDNYLMYIGGRGQNEWTLVYGLDIEKMRWFIFHVFPDQASVSAHDGMINDLGLFMVPRCHSFGSVYNRAKREVVVFLGSPMQDPPVLFVVIVGDALGFLHLRRDMLATCTPPPQ